MAYWRQIGQSKLKLLCTQFRRCYIQLPNASLSNSITSHRKPPGLETPYWVFQKRPTDIFHNVRFFAAPFQAKTKTEEKDNGEPRLNDEITAQFIRLVLDDGNHSVISRTEALQRARQLNLDLVEVQKSGKPPVCKIMDYNKEKYILQEKEKERAKIKSETSLRKGPGKEVRFSAKTELKDLKMKADMILKFMDKGYRVKCKATGTEKQDLKGTLSRLSSLIEDVSVLESGPHIGRKEAYMTVRHIKYGLPKKGAGKKLQDAIHTSVVKDGEASDSNEEDQNQSSAELDEEVVTHGDKHTPPWMGGGTSADHQTNAVPIGDSGLRPTSENRYKRNNPPSIAQEPSAVTENRYKRNNSPSITREPSAVTENRYKRNNSPSITQEPSTVTENRYKRNNNSPSIAPEHYAVAGNRYRQTDSVSRNNFPPTAREAPVMTEPRIRFQQTTSQDNTGLNERGSRTGDSFKPMPSVFNQKSQATPNRDVNSVSRNSVPPLEDIPKGGLSRPSSPNAPRSSFGIFSANKGLDTSDVRGMHQNREGVLHDSSQNFNSGSSENLRRGVQ